MTKKKKKKKQTFFHNPEIELYAQRVDELLNNTTKKALSIKQIFKNLKIRDTAAKERTAESLQVLIDQRKIKITTDGKFKGNAPSLQYTGIVDFVNPRFAFVITDEIEQDIWVDADDLNLALDGDEVKVQVQESKKGNRPEGKVIEVLKRNRTEFVGKIEILEKYAFVIPDHRKMHLDIFVPQEKINGAKDGQKVIVKVVKWHTSQSNPVGKVSEVLGNIGDNETEMHAILAEFDLPLKFPQNILNEAEEIPETITPREIRRRRDFRNITTFTIDPDTAKDFDDALSIQKLKNGNWEVGIHIADVTHYVKMGSHLDQEAEKRATSVYLVDRVVPMLPEKLSNGLCSLRPKEEKLSFSAVFELDERGNLRGEWFGRTVIYSDHRFTYEGAQEVIETEEGLFSEELVKLNQLAKAICQKRFDNGAISFETPEVKFNLDEKGKPIGIYVKERKDAHKLVEEFMLLANKRVAEFVFKLGKGDKEKTMVYRTHDDPDDEKLLNFAAFAKQFGHDIVTRGKALSASINRMSETVEGNPQQSFLQSLAIRTMAKAKYTTDALPHFGLAFDHYTHFTSPIRRYPDMMVHRLLALYLNRSRSQNREEYEDKCKHSSVMEKRAADAERASIKYKQVEFMQQWKDKDLDGVVTGVTEWGIYVEIVETKCEGMVRLADILDDHYDLDQENYRLIGRKTKKTIGIGDKVKVRVKNTNLENRTLDLEFVEEKPVLLEGF